MAGLVGDVSEFMITSELELGPEEGFHLFDAEHRSSYPLCIAYKAAQLAGYEVFKDAIARVSL